MLVNEAAAEAHCSSNDLFSMTVHLASGFGRCSAICDHVVAECVDVCDDFADLPEAQAEFARRDELLRLGEPARV